MLGDSRVRWVRGDYETIGYLKTTELQLSDDDDNVGTIKRGKLVNYKAGSLELMVYAEPTTGCLGILTKKVDLYGTTGIQAFRDMAIGVPDLPEKRGAPVTIRVPRVFAECEFEGTGVVGYDNLVCTSGAGKAIASNTPINTRLSCEKGCWKLAEEGDWVYAKLLKADLVPENDGELRILVQFVSPSLFVSDT